MNTVSAHFKPKDDQNNYNFGIGYLADTPCIRNDRIPNRIMTGVFHNTRYNPSAYIGCYANLYEHGMLEFGAMVGLVTGYEHAVMPTGLLIATLHVTREWNVRVSIAPVTGGVANLSFGYRF